MNRNTFNKAKHIIGNGMGGTSQQTRDAVTDILRVAEKQLSREEYRKMDLAAKIASDMLTRPFPPHNIKKVADDAMKLATAIIANLETEGTFSEVKEKMTDIIQRDSQIGCGEKGTK